MIAPNKAEPAGGAQSASSPPSRTDSSNAAQRPQSIGQIPSPTFESLSRHRQRKPSTPRQVKETLHARSEWSNSGDDGATVHRINQYVIKEEIGRGSFGSVHLAVDQYGNEYAVKEFSKSRLRKRAQSHILRRPWGRRPRPFSPGSFGHRLSPQTSHDGSQENPLLLIREEIAIMKKLNHPNLVSLLEVLDDPEEDSLYMVLEMCKKGVIMKVGMHEQADPYDDECCRCWFRDLILGIEYLHAQGVAHRDIKPDNLLLTEDDTLKIVDFGVSEIFEKSSDSLSPKSAGSPAFLPPELCVTKQGNISGRAADIWSMGITLYCLAFGRVPFEKTNILELYKSITDDPVLVDDSVDPDFRDLIYRLLEKDPEKRIKMEELRDHPWVTRKGADPLMSEEENASDVVEPPTEEELQRAITLNMGNLLAVVKAVKQFKRLLFHRKPEAFESILGQSGRIVQPPLQMDALKDPEEAKMYIQTAVQDQVVAEAIGTTSSDRKRGRSQNSSDSGDDPMVSSPGAAPGSGFPEHQSPAERAVQQMNSNRSNSSATGSGHQSRSHSHHLSRHGTIHEGKGQAHDPRTDTIYLGIGSNQTPAPNPDPDSNLVVSESPIADETNIYEKAYEEELERIRKEQGRHATVYSTRRVDKIIEQLHDTFADPKAKILRGATMSGPSPDSPLRKLMERAAAAKDAAIDPSPSSPGQPLADAGNTARQAGQQGATHAAEVFGRLQGKLAGKMPGKQ